MIHIRHLLTLFFISLLTLNVGAQTLTTDSIEHEVLLETSKGNIRVKLYNDTPIHRDNFLNWYDKASTTDCSFTVSYLTS